MTLKDTLVCKVPNSLVGSYRAWKQERRISGFADYEVTHLYGGYPLKMSIVDSLGRGWYDRDWPVPPELTILRDRGRLSPGSTVFDLGAHQCLVAMLLALEVGQSGLVVAVEGTQHNAETGLRNLSLNGIENVIVLHAVIAGLEGSIKFAASLNGHVQHDGYAFRTVISPTVTIDSLARDYGAPDVVYVDVEGFEQQVLGGALETLGHRPDWCVEVHAGVGLEELQGSVSEIVSKFTERNYKLFVNNAEGGEFEPLGDVLPVGRFHLLALG